MEDKANIERTKKQIRKDCKRWLTGESGFFVFMSAKTIAKQLIQELKGTGPGPAGTVILNELAFNQVSKDVTNVFVIYDLVCKDGFIYNQEAYCGIFQEEDGSAVVAVFDNNF